MSRIYTFSSCNIAQSSDSLLTPDPVLYSYPAEVQTYSMRAKGFLVWNTVTQIEYAYVTFVDAIALDAIGEWASGNHDLISELTSRLQVLCGVYAAHHHPVDPRIQV